MNHTEIRQCESLVNFGTHPPLNLKGFHGKDICFERSFKTSGHRRRVGGIKHGRNVYLELAVWLKLWTPPTRSYTESQMVLTTVLAAGLASFMYVYLVWVCCFLFKVYSAYRESSRLKFTTWKVFQGIFKKNRATWTI